MEKLKGFVYILEVRDIILPVCKIGMTKRSPQERCNEINNSSTGDFIWSVVHSIYVSDCQKLESLVHSKLKPLRQKGREFFNLNAEDANKALVSIFKFQSEIKEIECTKTNITQQENKKKRRKSLAHIRPEQVEILQSFSSLLQVKGRPFGQKGKPDFGISDGNKGVQWNLAICSDTNDIKLGVNLEGSGNTGKWLIVPFILAELKTSTIEKLKGNLDVSLNDITVIFSRDAWRIVRIKILEKYLGGKKFTLTEIDTKLWQSILEEALTCLDENREYRARGLQKVTEVLKNGHEKPKELKEVSPHLTIQINIANDEDIISNLQKGIEKLKPIYNWVNERCGIKDF